MATEKQKVLGLDSVEQIKTYVCFACENIKRDVILIMDEKLTELKSDLKSYTDNEITNRAVIKDENGDIVNYTLRSIGNDEINPITHWELNKSGVGQLSNSHIGWEHDGSGYIGKKNFYDKDKYEDIADPTFDDTIYWNENGIISFGKNVKPWLSDLDILEEKIMALIKQYHNNVPDEPGDNVYIVLNDTTTRLNYHLLAPSQSEYIKLNNPNTIMNRDKLK